MAKSTAKINAIAAAVRFRNKKTPEPRAGSGSGFGGARVDPEGARCAGVLACFNLGLMTPTETMGAFNGRDGTASGACSFGSDKS